MLRVMFPPASLSLNWNNLKLSFLWDKDWSFSINVTVVRTLRQDQQTLLYLENMKVRFL